MSSVLPTARRPRKGRAFEDGVLQPRSGKSNGPELLHEYFERQVRLQPERPAIEFNDEVLTYQELDRIADRVAALLRARGVVRGNLVALYLDKSASLIAAMLGVLKAGAGYVPLDPKFPTARVLGILEDCDATIVITDRELGSDLAHQTAAEVIFFKEDVALNVRPQGPMEAVAVAPDDVCYVIYTSGSTGRPKGVVIEHRNAVNFVRSLRTIYKLTPQDRVYQGFSAAFDASVEEIWGALAIGGTLVIPRSEVARSTIDAAEFITSRQVTYFSTVPSFLAMITSDLPTVRFLVLGGEVCSVELVNRWATAGRRMLNTYGPTEATVVATVAECHAGEPVSIGKALPGYVAHVLDDQLRPVAQGESGELYLGGESIARGYLNRPELNAESFIQDPFARQEGRRLYRTRDMVRVTEQGNLQFVGRTDAQIKIRGFRIELSEIESVLMEHPSVAAAVVNVVEFGTLKELASYVALQNTDIDLDREGVSELLRSRLPEYMIPRYLDVVDDLPQMTSGKVDRKALPPPVNILGRNNRDVVAAATDLERIIVDVWQKVFEISPISVDDDFFLDLRGHSLFAARASTELRAILKTVHVSVPDFYTHRTARMMAQRLAAAGVVAQSEHASEDTTQADAWTAARAPLSWFRWPCAVLQLVGLAALYAAFSAPFVFLVVQAIKVLKREQSFIDAFDIVTTASFFVWPAWLLLSIAIKWLVIGRYKPGRYRVWGFYYFRWWLVSRFQALSMSGMFVGTPLMTLYYRAMGAKIGRHSSIDTAHCTAFDLVSIGDNTSIGSETHILGYRVENGWLILGNVTVGSGCFVGTHCCLGLDSTMGDGARLDDLSHLPDNAVIEPGQGQCGSPAEASYVDLHSLQADAPGNPWWGRTFLFGFIHLVLIYAMGYLLALSALPGMAMVWLALDHGGILWAILAAFIAVPISFLWYLLLVVTVKRYVIGHIVAGVYSQYSKDYLRYWFLAYLLANTRTIVLPLYATVFLPVFLRLLGAKIGKGAEISTVSQVMPDLLEVGDGSFLADACIVGGHRTHLGLIEVRTNRIGKRSFIGNSALVPVGVSIGDNGLIGVMSAPPLGAKRTADGTRWLGSPGFKLPHTQDVADFSARTTYSPGLWLVVLRVAVEILRTMLPGMIAAANLVLFCLAILVVYQLMPLWVLAIVGPCIALVSTYLAVATVAWFKNRLIGKFKPVVKPLWCGYVWLNEVVNALYETVAAAAMAPLMGTPFISPCLRKMGCKVGRWAFIETTLFSEFDLVEIGDRACLNQGATIQTHLFEDRVMKSDHLKIGDECSVGNMTVVLYGTEMQRGSSLGALSVLMKGEVLPASTCWTGVPTRPLLKPVAPAVVNGRSAAAAVEGANAVPAASQFAAIRARA